jgi:hypothetical protein
LFSLVRRVQVRYNNFIVLLFFPRGNPFFYPFPRRCAPWLS